MPYTKRYALCYALLTLHVTLHVTLYIKLHARRCAAMAVTLVGLVLAPQRLQVLQRLLVGRLELEELGGVQAALLLARLHLHHQLLPLLPPVRQLLLQHTLLLVQGLPTPICLGEGERRGETKGVIRGWMDDSILIISLF